MRIVPRRRGLQFASFHADLAGIDAQYLWKQLQDFRSGKRKSIVMQQIIAPLTSRDAADVAAYFATLPNAPDTQFNSSAFHNP